MVTIQSSTEVQANLERLKQEGFTVVIGDVITIEVAQRLGLRGVLITSGREAIMNAIDEAKRIHHFFRRVNYRHHIYRQVLNEMPLPVMLVDEEGKVLEQNGSFAEIDPTKKLVHAESFIQLVRRVLDQQQIQWQEIKCESRIYQLQGFLVSKTEKIVGIQLNATTYNPNGQQVISMMSDPANQPLIGDSDRVHQLEEKIGHAAATDEDLYCRREGNREVYSRKQIHFKRFDQTAPILEIQGSLFTNESFTYLEEILHSLTSGTVIVKNMV